MANEPIPQGATVGEPIPQGATIGAPVTSGASQQEPIPQGATIGPRVGGDNMPAQHTPPHTGSILGDAALGALSGVGGAALETVEGAKNIVNKVLPASAQIPDIPPQYRQNVSTSEKIGGGLEDVGEFVAGDAALEGLGRAVKIVDAAKRIPALAETLKMAEKSKILSSIISGSMKSAAVGAAQGGVKGAAEGKGVEEAEGGAIGGAVGGAAGETLSGLAGALAKRVGVGTTAAEDAMRGFKPAKRNRDFLEHLERAAPIIEADPEWQAATKSGDLKAQVESIEDVRKNWWQQRVQPIIDQHKGVPLDGDNIANSIRAAIPDAMKKYSPDQAKLMEEKANQWIASGQLGSRAQALPSHNTFVGDAEEALEHYNALVSKTGYWSKTAQERAALLKTDGELAGNMATAKALRDELYRKLGVLDPATDMAELKKTYGSLRNVGDELLGQMNVAGRQAPTSLKEIVGGAAGIAVGGIHGLAAAALPFVDRAANTPSALSGRAVRKFAQPGVTSAGEKIGKAVSHAATKEVPAGTAALGEYAADEMTPTRVTFQASDGTMHSIPIDQLDAARKVDPGLTVGMKF